MGKEKSRELLEETLDFIGKVDKVIGFLIAVAAILSFASGRHILSYVLVLIAYVFLSLFLWRVITRKSIVRSLLALPSGDLVSQKKFEYPKSARVSAGLGIALITIAIIAWLGINVPKDIDSYLGSRRLGGRVSPDSGPRFTDEVISYPPCAFAMDSSEEIWAVASDPHNVLVEGTEFVFSEDSGGTVSAIFLTPIPIVIEGFSLLITEYSEPLPTDMLEFYVVPGCGRGGGAVPPVEFDSVSLQSARIQSRPAQYILLPSSEVYRLPYYLEANEALQLLVPLDVQRLSGIYSLRLSVIVVPYAEGDELTVISAPVEYRTIYLPSDQLDVRLVTYH